MFGGDSAIEGFNTEGIDEFLTTLDPNIDYEWSSFSQAPVSEWESMLSNDRMDLVFGEPPNVIVSQEPDHPMPTLIEEPTPLIAGDFSNGLYPKQRKARHRIRASEWDQKRELIAVLYIDQEKTLAETRQTLLEDYGFYASEKAYKDKLKEWKMVKNLKLRQVKFMLKMAKKRKEEEGKETVFSYNGRNVPNVRLQRYGDDVSINSIITSVPSLVTYHTPRILAPTKEHEQTVGNYRSVIDSALVESGGLPFLTTADENSWDLEALFQDRELHRLKQTLLEPSLLAVRSEHNDISHSATSSSHDCAEKYFERILAVFDEFTNNFISYTPSHFEQIVSAKQLVSLLEDLQKPIGWKQYFYLGLPILMWKSKYLLALQSYSQCEVTLGKIMDECTRSRNAVKEMRKIMWAATQLLAKAYLVQGKLYSLDFLLRNKISNMQQSENPENEMLWILKILLTCRTLRMKMASRTSRKYSEASLHFVAHTLIDRLQQSEIQSFEESQEVVNEARFMLVSLYSRLFRHKEFRQCADLVYIMKAVENIILTTPLCPGLETSANSLSLSYLYLGMCEEAVDFRRKWSNTAKLDETDPILSGVSANISDYVCTWLKGTWPYIELPRAQESLGVLGYVCGPVQETPL
ncbi:hypothetical protein MMC11_000606 [Xylographa trunciseda]|nr:hypothetical protein [Xylographa trunciseda]